MKLENGSYTETIHQMTSDQIWDAWKNQQLTFGQVNQWQQRHNYFFDINGDKIQYNNYNVYMKTEKEKYDFIDTARRIGAIITGVSGCGTGYYIQLDATDKQAEKINAALQEGATC